MAETSKDKYRVWDKYMCIFCWKNSGITKSQALSILADFFITVRGDSHFIEEGVHYFYVTRLKENSIANIRISDVVDAGTELVEIPEDEYVKAKVRILFFFV